MPPEDYVAMNVEFADRAQEVINQHQIKVELNK